MKNEKGRFLTFYDRLVNFAHDFVLRLPSEMLHWQPDTEADMRFGERVEDVTVESLYLHLVVGEHLWTRNLRDCVEGDIIPLPIDKDMTARLASGDYLADSLMMHGENLDIIAAFDDAHMARSLLFSDRKWSVQGFLWAIYGHRNYHIGNIDTYCRLAGAPAPDYFQFDPVEMA
ncbi:MAG: hypothetical protein ACC660_03505 [Acidimicrobiales bacterium]